MQGKITRIAVTYTVDTADGPRHTFHGLAHMREHIRPERLSELLDDLTVICEDLLTARRPTLPTAWNRAQRRPSDQRGSHRPAPPAGLWRDTYAITFATACGPPGATTLRPASYRHAALELRGLMHRDHARPPS